MNLFDFIFYNSLKIFVNIFFRLTYKLKIINSKVIPQKGGVLIVGNHSSWLDTLFLNCAIARPVWFVTGEFILKTPILGEIVKHLCIIPISRNNGNKGIEIAIEKIKEGNVVCIFPEGELTKTGELQRFRNGVALIQKQTNTNVIPFYISGAFESWSYKQKKPKLFKNIIIRFGETFTPSGEKDSEIANEIRNKVKALL